MSASRFLLGCSAVAVATSICSAGLIPAGKHCGVVIFDRWDGCTLYSGLSVLYVSEAVKEQLRHSAGKCVRINATKVHQFLNPGDGLIQAMTLLGPAPDPPAWASTAGLDVSVKPTFTKGHSPTFLIRVENVGKQPATIVMDHVTPTVLAKRDPHDWGPADGPSTAVVTHQSFWTEGGAGGPLRSGSNGAWQWSITGPATFEREITLRPAEPFEISLSFKFPAGEYDFLAGYGAAGQCVASNLVAFNVDDHGLATVVAVPGR